MTGHIFISHVTEEALSPMVRKLAAAGLACHRIDGQDDLSHDSAYESTEIGLHKLGEKQGSK